MVHLWYILLMSIDITSMSHQSEVEIMALTSDKMNENTGKDGQFITLRQNY